MRISDWSSDVCSSDLAPELKIIYVVTGTLFLSVEGSERQELPPGSIVLMPKNRSQVQENSKAPEHRFDVEGVLHSGPHNLMYIDAFVGTSYEVQVLCGWLRLGLTAEFNAFDGLLNPISANLNSSTFVRRSEEHTSELQSLMRISYAVFCLKKKIYKK